MGTRLKEYNVIKYFVLYDFYLIGTFYYENLCGKKCCSFCRKPPLSFYLQVVVFCLVTVVALKFSVANSF